MWGSKRWIQARKRRSGGSWPSHASASVTTVSPRLWVLLVHEGVGVMVEALRQAEAPLQDPGAHKGAGRVAGALEPLGQRGERGLQEEAAVVAHAVPDGQQAGQDRAV